jgi:2'-5' RNA ligase
MTMTDLPLFQEVEYKEEPGKSEAATEKTGAMIALRLRQDHIDRLALDDGEAPEELHTTILYLGKAASYGYDTRARIINAMREVALRHRYVTGNGFGINSWNAHGENPCIVLGVSGEEMVSIYNAIVSALQGFDLLQMPKQHEPWQPHVTLKYTDDFSEVAELVDLQGEVVYDAIRVVFGGLVDDIVLQPALAQNDGNAGVNRYENVPENKSDLGRCRYCKGKATKKIGIDGGAWIAACDDEDHQSRARKEADGPAMKTIRVPLSEMAVLEEKAIRRVRTAAGVRRYGKPIGSVITSDGQTLKHVKTEESEYDGYEKYSAAGKTIYTRKEGQEYVAYDESDNEIARAKTEEQILKSYDEEEEPASAGPNKNPKGVSTWSNFEEVESDYDGYDAYEAPDGSVVYREQRTNRYYDADDNPLSSRKLERMNNGTKKAESAAATKPSSSAPFGFKKEESEYDGYDKFVAGDGTPVYRDQKTLDYYDENDKKLSAAAMRRLTSTAPVQTDGGKTVTREEAGKVMNGTGKKPGKPMTQSESRSTDEVDDGQGERPDEVDEKPDAEPTEEDQARTARMNKRGQESIQKYNDEQGGSKEPAAQQPPADPAVRPDFPGRLDAPEEVDAALDKVNRSKGKKIPADVIKEIQNLAHRQRDIRNKRKLMLYAMQLSEMKVFAALCEMDPWLRATALEVKLITPGGRVGTDATLNRSRRRNWVENSPMKRLPKYIRIVANGLLKNGHSASKAIALAVAAVKRWARGGDNVRPKVQAAAVAAVAQWEALKASA